MGIVYEDDRIDDPNLTGVQSGGVFEVLGVDRTKMNVVERQGPKRDRGPAPGTGVLNPHAEAGAWIGGSLTPT
jgi:hypothetical protein